ncbi:MAG: transposase [Actinobacteria bacterium]|nr:transposase [Actinomycetota bacterium]
MNYVREESRVIYKSKDGVSTRQFDAVDFIASLVSHIPNKSEQMVRYLGFFSNVCRGKRKKDNVNDIEFIIQDTENTKGCNK